MRDDDLPALEALVAHATRIARPIADYAVMSALVLTFLLIVAHTGLYLERIYSQ